MVAKQAKPVVELVSSELGEIQRELNRQLANARNFNLMIFLGKNVTRKHSNCNSFAK